MLLVAVYAFSYLNISLNKSKEEKDVLSQKLDESNKEISQLKVSLGGKEQELVRLNQELSSLSYPQRLKAALSAAQDMINSLNMELSRTKEKWSSMSDENFSIKARLQSNTKEVSRLLDELQDARVKIKELVSTKDIVSSSDISGDFDAKLREKEREMQDLKQNLEDLNNKYKDLLEEKDSLTKDAGRFQQQLARAPAGSLQAKIDALNRALEDKEREKMNFEFKLAEFTRERDSMSFRVESYNNKIQELTLLNSNLQSQLVKLTSDLRVKDTDIKQIESKFQASTSKASGDVEIMELKERLDIQRERLKTVTILYNKLKGHLREFSEILYAKDSQLADRDKQIETLKEEASYLKIKSESLEEAFKESQKNQRAVMQRLSQVTNLNSTLQDRLDEVSFLLKRDALQGKSATGKSYNQGNLSSTYYEDISAEKASADELGDRLSGLVGSFESGRDSTEDLKRKVEVILQSVEGAGSFEEEFDSLY